MKKYILITMFALLPMQAMALTSAEDGWWNSLLNMVGMGEESEEAKPSLDGLLGNIQDNLGVSSDQAKGGLASLINVAKQNLSEEQFASLSEYVPGLDSVLEYLPVIEEVKSEGLSGLVDKAAGYNETLGQLNEVKKQFDSLGLDTDMIKGYASQATEYLDTPQGQEAKKLLTESLFNF